METPVVARHYIHCFLPAKFNQITLFTPFHWILLKGMQLDGHRGRFEQRTVTHTTTPQITTISSSLPRWLESENLSSDTVPIRWPL
jgi:hypothetical protein